MFSVPHPPFRTESTRSDLVESVHLVSVAVVDTGGRLFAHAGDAARMTYWRSSAKPFQALPLVQDGAADAFGFGPEELALACASHSSEPRHREVCMRMLAASGSTEEQLACGPHPPISTAIAESVIREGTVLTPRWSNCSGKHAGMLALARHHGWPTEGYQRAGHPVQERILQEVMRWTGLRRESIHLGVDGCTAVCFALPLHGMALAYARFGTTTEPAAMRLREAMWSHPELVAGTGRLCTELLASCPHRVLAKVGAEGVYSAALPELGLGVALKVEDGHGPSGPVALLSVLSQLAERHGISLPLEKLAHHAEPPQRNTRGELTGTLRPAGGLTFS